MSEGGQTPQNASGEERDEFAEALKKGGDEGLKDAFRVLSKGSPTAPLKDVDLQRAVAIRGRGRQISVEEAIKEASQIIQEVNKQALFTCEEFICIVKLLEEPVDEADQTKTIYEKLKKLKDHETIVLYGREGVGKTWAAREVANHAVRKGDFDAAIWVYLNRIYKDGDMSLPKSIAYQLSLLADFEDEEAEKKEKAEEAKKQEPDREAVDLDDKIAKKAKENIEKLIELIVDNLKGKKILFVLDGDGHGRKTEAKVEAKVVPEMKMEDTEAKVVPEMKMEDTEAKVVPETKMEDKSCVLKLTAAGGEVVTLEFSTLETYKVMITERTERKQGESVVMVKPFTWEESKSLAARAIMRERVKEDKKEEVEELARYFMFRSERLPSQLLLISRIVTYFGKKDEPELQKLRDDRATIKKEEEGVKLLDVLIKRFEERLPKSVLIDCYGPDTPGNHFLRRGRAVSFNEVICYWIMEGHLGPFDRVDEAYHKGHRVLMELMDCGLLQKQEADYVAPSGATSFTFHINDYKEFFSCVRPGIGVTFDMSLGRVALGDGMIRTISSSSSTSTSNSHDKQRISALLLDGNRIGEEELPMKSLSKHRDLVEILAISDPTSQHFKLPILEMKKLRLLALRGCQFLNSLDPFLWKKPDEEDEQSPQTSDKENDKPPQKPEPPAQITENLDGLTVLEISGPNSHIKEIPPKLFDLMRHLKTVNLSHLSKVKFLPPSFYSLAEIEFLILRGCESLQKLDSLKNFKDLKILDVSGSTSFEKFEDKSLHTNTKLQILNLSKTNLKTLPLINQLKELKFVWLKDCPELPRIRKIDKMENLQIFDISGAGEVERFCDPSLEDLLKLVIVDISSTKIKRLPANLGDPTYLYARNCLKLKVVPPVEGLKKLEVLDLSGCIHLKEVRPEFFAKVKLLRNLDLSGTNVQQLPFLDGDRSSLRRLVLSGCKLLEKVDKLSYLKELELLDLSGCEKVKELEKGSFDDMEHLEHLYLSGTGIGKSLPSLSKLKNLKELYVRDCPNLTELPGVEQIPNLQLLDYSGTVLEPPPCFSKDPRTPRLVGAGIESIDTIQLFRNLGAEQGGDQGAKWRFEQKDVSQCNWIMRIGSAEKCPPVYGVHFLRLLEYYPLFLTQNLSKFCFLVYPSEAEAKVQDRLCDYDDQVSLREIYLGQVCEEKMERCLEIREFKKLPENLGRLIAQAQFVVLVDDLFLESLLDLRVDTTMPMKACWIESCSNLQYVVAAPPKVEEKMEEAGKGEGQQRKNGKRMELVKGGGDQRKKVAAEKAREAAGKGRGDQKKNANAADKKVGEPTKSEGGQQQQDAADEKSREPAQGQSNEPKNTGADNLGESEKGEGDRQKNAAEEKSGGDDSKNAAADNSGETASSAEVKSGDAAKNEGNQQNATAADTAKSGGGEQKNAAEEKSGDAAKNEGNQQNATAADTAKSGGGEQKNAAEEKSGDAAKNEGNQQNAAVADTTKIRGDEQKNAAEEESGDAAKNEGNQQNAAVADTTKIRGDEQKNAAEEKSGDAAKNESNQQNTAVADTTKIGGDEQKIAAEEKSGDASKNESNQQNTAVADTTKIGGDEQKNAAEEKSGDADKNEGNQQNATTADIAKIGGDQQKNAAEGDSAKSEGGQQKTTVTDKKSGESAKNESDQPKNSADDSREPSKIGGDQQKNTAEKPKNEGEEAKNPAEDLNNLETLWISDVPKMECVCKGDIKSVSFNFLKSLYLEYCPELSEMCSSSLQLQSLETLFIKYCQKLVRLFGDENASVMKKLRHLQLWGLDKLQKISCKTPSLSKLRVGECPLLEHVIASTVTDSKVENEGHENLEILHIKSCDNLQSIFEDDNYVVVDRLTDLELSGLPKLKKVALQAQSLRFLRVGDCPSLISVIDDSYKVPHLETLEVKTCEKMKTIIGGDGSKLLDKVKKIKLLGLPELEEVGAKVPKNEGDVIWACPKLKDSIYG